MLRTVSARVLALLFAVGWLTVGFGAVDLVAAWWPDWPQVLEGGWGAFVTAILAIPFVLLATRRRGAPLGQLSVGALALGVSGIAAHEPPLLLLDAVLVGQIVAMAALTGVRGAVNRAEPAGRLLAVATLGAVPWFLYALHMWSANRHGPTVDNTDGIDHWAMQGALGLALASLPLVAALRASLRPLAPVCAAAAAAYLGIVSLAARGSEGALGRTWAVAAIVWALALVASAHVPRRR